MGWLAYRLGYGVFGLVDSDVPTKAPQVVANYGVGTTKFLRNKVTALAAGGTFTVQYVPTSSGVIYGVAFSSLGSVRADYSFGTTGAQAAIFSMYCNSIAMNAHRIIAGLNVLSTQTFQVVLTNLEVNTTLDIYNVFEIKE